MKDEYDFSKGTRGQFYKADAKLNIPVYLDTDVEDFFAAKAKEKGVNIQQLINALLRKDIALISEVI